MALTRAGRLCQRPCRAGLDQLDERGQDGALARSHLLPAVRADLLRRLGRFGPAASAYRQALELTANDAERAFLRRRLLELDRNSGRRAGS